MTKKNISITTNSKKNKNIPENNNPVEKSIGKDADVSMPTLWGSPQKWIKQKFMQNIADERKFIVNMQLRAGDWITFQAFPKDNKFTYAGGTYIIDENLKYYNRSAKSYCLNYHQDFSLPIKHEIPVTSIHKAIESTGICEVENSTNPSALTKVLEAKLGEGIAKASQLPDFIKQMRMLVTIGAVSSVVHLVLFVIKSGMLKQISI